MVSARAPRFSPRGAPCPGRATTLGPRCCIRYPARMRREKIELAALNSFVHPTTAYFPSNLSGVGPSGYGKSNMIDAGTSA